MVKETIHDTRFKRRATRIRTLIEADAPRPIIVYEAYLMLKADANESSTRAICRWAAYQLGLVFCRQCMNVKIMATRILSRISDEEATDRVLLKRASKKARAASK